jgi:hypothetical protein
MIQPLYVCNEDTVYVQENDNADCYENTARADYRVRKQLVAVNSN